MCKLMANLVMWLLLLTSAIADATPISNTTIADAGSKGTPILLTAGPIGYPGALYESATANAVSAPEHMDSLSAVLPSTFVSDVNAQRAISHVGTFTRVDTYLAGLFLPVSEPVSLLLFGRSLLGLAGMIRRPTRGADHSSSESEESQLPATYREPNQSAFRVQK